MHVIVTGGSRGIGRAVVDAFATKGHQVLFTYNRDAEGAAAVAADYLPVGRVRCEPLDQGDFQQVQELTRRVASWLGEEARLDVLVNNAALGSATVKAYCGHDDGVGVAGSSKGAETAQRAATEDEALMRVNALGPVWLTEALLPLMIRKSFAEDGATPLIASADAAGLQGTREKPRSTVLFIGSVGGASQSVFPGFKLTDAMSKAALAYAVRCLAARHVHGDVSFLCLSPGATETDMFRASTLSSLRRPGHFVDSLPQRSLIAPVEIAEAVLWLCSCSAARVFHGAVLDASAGLAVRPGVLTEYDFEIGGDAAAVL